MDVDPTTTSDDGWSAAIAAAILRRGSMVHTASLILTGVALVVGGATPHGHAFLIAAVAMVALGAAEFWLAARVALDADLFDALAAHGTDLASFDRAMQRLRLMPPGKAGRPLDARIRGAMRLLKLQVLMLGLQLTVIVVLLLWG